MQNQQMLANLPQPSAYLDPLYGLDSCYYYAVPKFYPLDHPNTRWLLTILKSQDIDRLKRKLEITANAFRTSYFQLLDCPSLYNSDEPVAQCLFHRQTILYLTLLGMALYLKRADVIRLTLEYRDTEGEPIYSFADPQYATHVLDSTAGDFHAYPMTVIVLRSGYYEIVPDLLAHKWNPLEPICMPARRRYERRAYYFFDWLEYCLWIMSERPMLRLARLVYYMTMDLGRYKFQRLPISVIKPKNEDERVLTGLVGVEQLPKGAKMIGVKSLIEITEAYSNYKDRRRCYIDLKNCLTQIRADGYSPEIVVAEALDMDGGDVQNKEIKDYPNNNDASEATWGKHKKRSAPSTDPYASEATRVLLHIHKIFTKPFCKTPLLPLLDAVGVYIKRNIYLIENESENSNKACVSKEDQKTKKKICEIMRRDSRNAVVIILNLLQHQISNIEELLKQQKELLKKRNHIDPNRNAAKKRLVLMKNMKRLVGTLLKVLLYSRQVLNFINADFPLYNDREIDLPLDPRLSNTFRDIQLEVISELSLCKVACNFMSIGELKEVTNVKPMLFNLRVGKTPTMPQNTEDKSEARKATNLLSNTNQSSVTSLDSHYLLIDLANMSKPAKRGNVSFKRIKRIPHRPSLTLAIDKAEDKKAEDEPVAPEKQIEVPDNDRSDNATGPMELTKLSSEVVAVSDDVAKRLAEQIAQLRQRSIQEGKKADAELASIYSRILDDLKKRAAIAEIKADETTVEQMEQSEIESFANRYKNQQNQARPIYAIRNMATVRPQCRKIGGGLVVKRRAHKLHNLGKVKRPKCYQMVQVYEAHIAGAEFLY